MTTTSTTGSMRKDICRIRSFRRTIWVGAKRSTSSLTWLDVANVRPQHCRSRTQFEAVSTAQPQADEYEDMVMDDVGMEAALELLRALESMGLTLQVLTLLLTPVVAVAEALGGEEGPHLAEVVADSILEC